jgi:hypothetical protein
VPPLPSVPRTLKITYKWSIGEDLGAMCREFYQYTGTGPDNTDCLTVAGNIFGSYTANLAELATPDRILTEVSVVDLSSPIGGFGITSGSSPGTRSGTKLPASACVLESQIIHRRYRGGHSRTYWPFGAEDDMLDAQTWEPELLTAVATQLATHLATWQGSNPPSVGPVSNVNVSYYEGFTVHTGTTGRARNVSTPRGTPLVDVVVDTIIRAGIAQVRKRLLGLA